MTSKKRNKVPKKDIVSSLRQQLKNSKMVEQQSTINKEMAIRELNDYKDAVREVLAPFLDEVRSEFREAIEEEVQIKLDELRITTA